MEEPGEGEAGAVGPETLAGLVDRLGVKAVLDLIATAGMYVLLAFLAKTSMVELEADMLATEPDW